MEIRYYRWNLEKYWFDYRCACGKKGYSFKTIEEFTPKELEMYQDYAIRLKKY
jgi:hypothetical protein